MTIHLRRAVPADATAVGDICYRSFKAVAEAHGFAPDFPSPDAAAALLGGMIEHAEIFGAVAEIDGRVVGSNFLDERNAVSGIGPITVDPAHQNGGTGRALMQAVMRRSSDRGFPGMRLVQAGYHNRSLALYLGLGFDVREHLACVQGPAIATTGTARTVRVATTRDLPACDRLCMRAHGHDRAGELADAVAQGAARVTVRDGRVTGYATAVAFFGHAVGETNDDLQALIADAASFPGPGFLLPTSNGELLRWCLREGLRIVHTMTLMTIGLYNRPAGAWLPSVVY